jgi:hypothetical protein
VALAAFVLLPVLAWPQARLYNGGKRARVLVTRPIDEKRTVVRPGNTHPAANAANDRGAVPDGFRMEHMLLQLRRPAELEEELRKLVDEMYRPGSPEFHHWLTAEEMGERFGPAEEDVEKATAWLGSHGFEVHGVAPNGIVADFSGTAGQVRNAFQTEIHHLEVDGKLHIGNISDPRVPAALAEVVHGVVSLHDFMPHPNAVRPQLTTTVNGSTMEAFAPGDMATIYGLNSVFGAGITGSGQTIAVVEDSTSGTSRTSRPSGRLSVFPDIQGRSGSRTRPGRLPARIRASPATKRRRLWMRNGPAPRRRTRPSWSPHARPPRPRSADWSQSKTW